METIAEQVRQFFLSHNGRYQLKEVNKYMPHLEYESMRNEVNNLLKDKFLMAEKIRDTRAVRYFRPLELDSAYKKFITAPPPSGV